MNKDLRKFLWAIVLGFVMLFGIRLLDGPMWAAWGFAFLMFTEVWL